MVTAWSSSRMSRARSSAGPLRMLWVAMLLFAFVYAHGVSAEAVTAHLAAGATVSTAASADGRAVEDMPVDHHGGGHGPSPQAEECMPGQPQESPALDAPGACALVDADTSPSVPPAPVAFGDVASAKQLPSSSIRATVLQI
ncbi:hypothetical protein [Streptomyces sp. NPDC059909]|uniref:hypothetical protein n=1 Tax=Streptomyces sp. NPDC059909 TaxID=3346998 RepID=UPI003665A624